MTGAMGGTMKGAENSLDQRFADAMGQLLGPDFPSDIALAVSGGGDSMAMLTLAHNWTRVWGVTLWVVTVDHGLRPESVDEAAIVAQECALLGHKHATLRWHWDGKGNVQDEARKARLDLIDRWRGALRHVLVAHTKDDLAETFLMRLKRGSGVEGLSAMQERRLYRSSDHLEELRAGEFEGDLPPQTDQSAGQRSYEILRPCLSMTRQELRHHIKVLKTPWAEDPSNEDRKYDRVKMRHLLRDLEPLGLGVDLLAGTAQRLRRAQEALAQRACQVWREIGSEGVANGRSTGDLLLNRDGFAGVERDTQLRLLAAALQYVSTNPYRPRETPLEELLDRALAGGGGTLHGCELRAERENLRIFREEKALISCQSTVGTPGLWDQRWRVFHPDMQGLTIRALGDAGWQSFENKREATVPYHAARSLPSIWDGNRLVACDALGIGPGKTSQLRPMGRQSHSFTRFLLSH